MADSDAKPDTTPDVHSDTVPDHVPHTAFDPVPPRDSADAADGPSYEVVPTPDDSDHMTVAPGPDFVVLGDADRAVASAADKIAAGIALAVAANGIATVAMSGGSTAPALIDALIGRVPRPSWPNVWVFQVDERVAPDGHDDRNATQLEPLRAAGAHLFLMPVTEEPLADAAARYAGFVPERLDVVHLGIGSDGHTASWPPAPHADSDAPERPDRVTIVHDFNGRDRMTLTHAPIAAARLRVFLATGASKVNVVAALMRQRGLNGSEAASHAAPPTPGELPALRLRQRHTTVFIDRAAAPESGGL